MVRRGDDADLGEDLGPLVMLLGRVMGLDGRLEGIDPELRRVGLELVALGGVGELGRLRLARRDVGGEEPAERAGTARSAKLQIRFRPAVAWTSPSNAKSLAYTRSVFASTMGAGRSYASEAIAPAV